MPENTVPADFVKIEDINSLPLVTEPLEGKILYYDEEDQEAPLKTAEIKGFRKEIQSGIVGEATTSSSPTAYNPTDYPDGLYEKYDIKTAGTYTNFKDSTNTAIVVTSGDLLNNFVQIWVKNGVSQKVVTPLPNTNYNTGTLNPSSTTAAETGKTVSDYVTNRVKVQDTLFNTIQQEKTTKQTTAALPITNGSVSTVYGVSGSAGIIANPRTKVTILFAQNSANPVTQIEIRLFQGKTAGGTPIITKRQTVSPGAVTQASATIELGTTITYSGECWVQILMDKPFAYKYNNTTNVRTVANGYGPITVTTTNNLDGTSFPTSQGASDLYIEFNEVENVIVPTTTGSTVISSPVTENVVNNITGDYTALNSYLKSDGTIATSTNWRTSELIPVTAGSTYTYKGATSQSTAAVGMVGYNSSNVPTVLVGNTDNYTTPVAVVIPAGIVNVRVCGYFSTPPTLTISEPKIKSTLIPSSSASGKIEIKKTWNCVGHSIWEQDGQVYSSTTTTAIGIQTLVKRLFKFNGYNKYCYSGRSLGATASSGDTNSITNYFSAWTDTSAGFWTLDTITNDFKRNIPIGTITDYNNANGVTTYYGALRAFNDKVQSLTPGATIICFNALKRNNSGYTSTSTNTAGHTLLDYEKAIMAIASLNGWRFIDQFRQSEITDETLTITTLDGLHPNNFGYTLVAKPVIKEFWILANEK